MLIIPIQNKPDWRRPPLVCFALILANLLVYVLYQSGDEARWQAAEEYYFSSTLPELDEARFYEFVDTEKPEWRTLAQGAGEDFMYEQLLWSREFHDWLVPQLQQEGGEAQQWLSQRQEFAQLRDSLSSFAYGLTPADPTLKGLFGHMFLHGGWDHLLGNMVFLLLFGLSVELALGAAWFLGLYLLGGLAAAGLHMGVEAGSLMPMIGASGAVSAVMGMFVAVYGIRRLRFFYTLGFAFGEFSAPALMVLPLWLGKEVFGYFFGSENIAYWAHFGGLVAGFVCTMALIRVRPSRDIHVEEDLPPTPEQLALARIESLQNHGKLLEAGQAASSALKQHPESLPLIEKSIELTGLAPKSEAHHRAWLALFALAKLPQQDFAQIAAGVETYRNKVQEPRALTPRVCLALAQRAAREKQWALVEVLLQRLQQKQQRHPLMARLANGVVEHYRRCGDEERARQALDFARALQPSAF
ncbi:rhomboid family intramembrane serine protease [Microbulbifer agarilyticus]|uniref:rhomboid family intramembrane serine protease n=1 Tax=Microbulbifer agarilyticus TaxID=260552 RepID=UPI001CD750D5|nr:rhomboid family intramembrane serine protease [Microbulbifer agarilyticus]MCA0892540.1 rhomboid family intramembrane serine protease [Microbulbifer agarilyticus]